MTKSSINPPPGEWRNPVRVRLEAGEVVIGVTITTNSLDAAAHAAALGFDFLWVEMEHSPLTLETLRGIVLATRGRPAMVFARVPVVELWTAKRVLDQGVTGVVFPFVSTPELAQRAAAACRYPPIGCRGSGAGLATSTWPEPGNYYDSADANVLTVVVMSNRQRSITSMRLPPRREWMSSLLARAIYRSHLACGGGKMSQHWRLLFPKLSRWRSGMGSFSDGPRLVHSK